MYTPTVLPIGNFKIQCGQSLAVQPQQQVSYEPQQASSAQSCIPRLQFFESVATRFNVELDCQKNQVKVTNIGWGQPDVSIPIQRGGKWSGAFQYFQQIQDDGQGHPNCWVTTIVNFNGNAQCHLPQQSFNWATTVDFSPSSAVSRNAADNAFVAADVSPSPSPSLLPSAVPSPLPPLSPLPPAHSLPPVEEPGSVAQGVECVVAYPCPMVAQVKSTCPSGN